MIDDTPQTINKIDTPCFSEGVFIFNNQVQGSYRTIRLHTTPINKIDTPFREWCVHI
jgi:hypothetical protein